MNDNVKVTVSELLFYIFAGSLLFAKGMGFYEGQWPFDILVIVAYSAFAIRVVVTRQNIYALIVTMVATILGIVIYHNSGEMGALFHLTFLVGMFGISERRIWKGAYYIWIFTFIVQFITSFVGINPNNIYRIHQKAGQYVVRWSLGYTHPNVLHISYVILIMLIMYVNKYTGGKLIKATFLAFIGNLIVFAWSFSYTGMLFCVVYLGTNLILSSNIKKTIISKIIVVCIVPFAALFSVFGPVLIKGRLFDIINKALSTRFELSRYYLTTQPITLLGTRDFVVSDQSIVLDCSYVYGLMHYGIVFFVLLTVGLLVAVVKLWNDNEMQGLAIVLAITIAGITEPFLSNTSFKNIVFIFLGSILYSNLNRLDTVKLKLLGSIGDRTITFNTGILKDLKRNMADVIISLRRLLVVVAAIAVIAGSVGYLNIEKHPDYLYSLLWKCDRKPTPEDDPFSENVYLDIENLPDDFNGLILSYQDADTPLYQYDGFTLEFEYLRRAIGWGFTISFVITCSCVTVLGVRRKRHEEN